MPFYFSSFSRNIRKYNENHKNSLYIFKVWNFHQIMKAKVSCFCIWVYLFVSMFIVFLFEVNVLFDVNYDNLTSTADYQEMAGANIQRIIYILDQNEYGPSIQQPNVLLLTDKKSISIFLFFFVLNNVFLIVNRSFVFLTFILNILSYLSIL